MAWSVVRRQGDDGQGEGIEKTEGRQCPAYNTALSRQGKEQGQCYGIMGCGQEPGEFHLELPGARWLGLSPLLHPQGALCYKVFTVLGDLRRSHGSASSLTLPSL